MSFFRTWDAPFYTGTSGAGTSVGIGGVYDVALAGRGYMLDLAQQGEAAYGFDSLPLLQRYYAASQQDVNIGERSLNPEDYWRRSADTFHKGAGQTFFDHPDSDQARYRASKGIDPWTQGQFSLLNDTFLRTTDSNTNLALAVAGANLYLLTGNALKYLTDVSAGSSGETTVTADGTTAALSSPTSITSDGYTVWVCDGTRVNFTTRGAATFGAYHASSTPATIVRSVKGRLITVSTTAYRLQTHSGAAGAAVATTFFDHPNTDWVWTDIAGGPAAIYFSGFAGEKSAIYRTAVQPDGTALAVPTVAAELPAGEIARSLFAYLGVLMIGTDKGVRLAAMSDDGSLQLGGLITTTTTYCFDAQDRFVWFGWNNYDSTSTGLGRLDLSVFNNINEGTVITPAYASDLMATGQGTVSSVVTFGSKRIFTVQGLGLYAEDTTNRVASGVWYSGWINYGLAFSKTAVKASASYRAGTGTFAAALTTGGSTTYTPMGDDVATSTTGGNASLPAAQQVADEFELRFTLTRGSADHTTTPVISMLTLLANPQPPRRVKIRAPLMFHQRLRVRGGGSRTLDPSFERAQIEALLQSNQIVTWQESGASYAVTVDDFHWVPYAQVDRKFDGTMIVELKIQA